jgi:alpha-L-fucosidase
MDRRTFLKAGVAGTAACLAGGAPILAAAPRPKPTADQLAWQRDEVAIFLHFGVNTFTDREWGDGTEKPSIFEPTALDARQWARAARAGGFRAMILTAKHHDGFCLWPTRTTTHSGPPLSPMNHSVGSTPGLLCHDISFRPFFVR